MVRRARTDSAEPTQTKRQRRNPEQIVADLQAEIERVKARAAAQRAKADPQARALLAAAKALNRAIEVCSDSMQDAAQAARAILADEMRERGIRAPQRRGRRQEAA